MAISSSTCVNCGTPVFTPYCANCGQSHPPKKLSLLTLYKDFQSRVYGFDGMFPRTLRDLTLRPGDVARTYIEGNRVKYVGPVGYFFLMLTIFIVMMELLNVSMYDLSTVNNPLDVSNAKEKEAIQHIFIDFISRHLRIYSFLLIPVTASIAWLFFRKQGLNLLEHSILVFYVGGHLLWLSIIGLFTLKYFQLNLISLQLIVHFFLYGLGCSNLYKSSSKGKQFAKGIVVYILAYVIFTLGVSIATVAYMLSDPEMLKIIKGANAS